VFIFRKNIRMTTKKTIELRQFDKSNTCARPAERSKFMILSACFALSAALVTLPIASAPLRAQTRKEIFQPGEELVYKVKYGFVKLGTVVIQTGQYNADGTVSMHMRFWTADVPFLNVKTNVTDQFDTRGLYLRTFEEHTVNSDDKIDKYMWYDPDTKVITYSDDDIKKRVVQNAEPFDDAVGVLFSMRTWSGAVGHKYLFHVRDKGGEKPITVNFTNQIESQEVPALDDKEVRTHVLEGTMDMHGSSPLGADGGFTAYVSDDEAAVPVRIDMKIAVGSISLVLDKIKRTGWSAAK
jgi:hypothetical protein